MASFGDALKKGVDAQKLAASARGEVGTVLNEASREIAEVLTAPITLQFQTVDRPSRGQSATEFAAGIAAPREKVLALTARLDRGPFTMLAEASFAERGYPVSLKWADQFLSSSDRAGFEQALRTLLEDARTAEALTKLAAQHVPPAAT